MSLMVTSISYRKTITLIKIKLNLVLENKMSLKIKHQLILTLFNLLSLGFKSLKEKQMNNECRFKTYKDLYITLNLIIIKDQLQVGKRVNKVKATLTSLKSLPSTLVINRISMSP